VASANSGSVNDGGGVGVDEDDAEALFLKGRQAWDAGIVEFAALADDDRAGADDEDRVDVGAFGHFLRRFPGGSGAKSARTLLRAGRSPMRYWRGEG